MQVVPASSPTDTIPAKKFRARLADRDVRIEPVPHSKTVEVFIDNLLEGCFTNRGEALKYLREGFIARRNRPDRLYRPPVRTAG